LVGQAFPFEAALEGVPFHNMDPANHLEEANSNLGLVVGASCKVEAGNNPHIIDRNSPSEGVNSSSLEDMHLKEEDACNRGQLYYGSDGDVHHLLHHNDCYHHDEKVLMA